MLKKHIAACMFATALVAAPAIAQTGAQPQAPAGGAPLMNETAPAMPAPGAMNPSTTPGASGMQGRAMGGADATLAIAKPGHDLRLEGGFIAAQTPGHHLGTDMIGLSVFSADDDNVGSINDLVVDGENRVVGAVVGVGGFLGVGQRDVAIPLSEIQFVYDVETTASVGAGGSVARDITEARVSMTSEQIKNAPQYARLEAAPVGTPAPAPRDAAPRN